MPDTNMHVYTHTNAYRQITENLSIRPHQAWCPQLPPSPPRYYNNRVWTMGHAFSAWPGHDHQLDITWARTPNHKYKPTPHYTSHAWSWPLFMSIVATIKPWVSHCGMWPGKYPLGSLHWVTEQPWTWWSATNLRDHLGEIYVNVIFATAVWLV